MTSIAILLHELDDAFDSNPYLLKPMLGYWQRRGFNVVTLRGTHSRPQAELLIPHLDLTATPPDYAAVYADYPRVLNRRVLDIAKSSFSANLVSRDSAYDGPVIVKTDGNYGGLPERRLARRSKKSPVARLARRLARLADKFRSGPNWRGLEHLTPDQYPVFESLAQVPPEVFDNPSLVVEKFLAERDGDAYCLRYYSFLGDRETSLRFLSHNPIAKGANIHHVEECPVPEELRQLRCRLGFDYGKFDYVMHAGRAEVFDVNRTPFSTVLRRFDLYESVTRHLAGGIDALLDGSPRP
ncbi:MAG: hypothetical protein WC474_10650 [Hydrogenophilaceae bacterium]